MLLSSSLLGTWDRIADGSSRSSLRFLRLFSDRSLLTVAHPKSEPAALLEPRVLGLTLDPAYLVQILDTVPTRKVIQLGELSTGHLACFSVKYVPTDWWNLSQALARLTRWRFPMRSAPPFAPEIPESWQQSVKFPW